MDNYETRHAIREANKIELEDAYFNARPQLDFKVNRNIFGAGFDRAWDKQSENSAKLEQQRDELQFERDNYKSVAEAHSGAFQECIRLREQRDELLAALEKISCQTQSDNFLWWQIEAPAEGGSMSEELEQTALRVAAEMDNVYLRNVPAVVLQEFARRLVAALGAQEPVGFVYEKTLSAILKSKEACIRDTQIQNGSPLYAAPYIKEGWQMVPKEPTEAMLMEVGTMDGWDGVPSMADENHVSWYKAMLAAAPEYKP